MSHDEFTKLFRYMTERFDKIEKVLETKTDKTEIDRIYNILDRMEKDNAFNRDERIVMGFQMQRMDKWIQGIAKEINYKLST